MQKINQIWQLAPRASGTYKAEIIILFQGERKRDVTGTKDFSLQQIQNQ